MPLGRAEWVVAAQIVVTITVAIIGTFLADWFGLRSIWNALWMFALPAVLGITLNEGVARQLIATLLLMTLSVATTMATAAIFGIVY